MNSSYSPINWQKGLEAFGGDEDMYRGMVFKFEEFTFDEAIHKIDSAMSSSNWSVVAHQADDISGVCSYLGAQRMEALAFNLKQAAKTSNEKSIKNHYLEFLMEAKLLKAYIAKLKGTSFDSQAIDEYMTRSCGNEIRYSTLKMSSESTKVGCCTNGASCSIF